MKFYLAVTDDNWFNFLVHHGPEEVNFWRPSSTTGFRAIREGAPFLFKLKSPNNFVVGGGFFVKHLILPLSLTWDAFGIKNGASTYDQFRQLIINLCQTDGLNPSIGRTILAEPFFFSREDWIPVTFQLEHEYRTGQNLQHGRRDWRAAMEPGSGTDRG